MKHAIFIIFILAFIQSCTAQTVNNIYASGGISQTIGPPTFKPGAKGNVVAIDTITGLWYVNPDRYSGATWQLYGSAVIAVSGCSTPAFTPGRFDATLAVNGCDTGANGHGPELYAWDGAAWQLVAGGSSGGGGTWGSITGTLSAQTDLQSALDGKANSSHTHPLSDITQSGATSGQVPKWNGSAWVPSADNNTGTTYTAGSGISINGSNVISNTGDLSSTNELNTNFQVIGGNLRITDAGGNLDVPVSSIAPDQSATNEIQQLDTFAIVSNVLRASLSGDGVPFKSVNLSPYLDNTDAQTLSFSSPNLTISGGNSADLSALVSNKVTSNSAITGATKTKITYDSKGLVTSGSDATTSDIAEGSNQYHTDERVDDRVATLIQNNTGISWSYNDPAGTLTPTLSDNSATNELQTVDTFTLVSNVLRLSLSSDGQPFKSVNLAPYLDNTDSQSLSLSGQSLSISGGTGVTLPVVNVSAGAGISVSPSSGNYTITNTGDTNASDDITNSTSAGGDLSGTYPNPTVDGLQGTPVSSSSPSSGQVLKFNGTAWAPGTDNTGGGGGGGVSTVTGDAVDNTDPANPVVMAIPLDNTGLGLTGYGGDFSWRSSPGDFESGFLWDRSISVYDATESSLQGSWCLYTGYNGSNRAFVESNGEETVINFGSVVPEASYNYIQVGIGAVNIGSQNYLSGLSKGFYVLPDDNANIAFFNQSGGYELQSTTGTLIPPKMTTTQRDALTPVEGGVIYNTTVHKLQVYDGTTWQNAW